MNENDRSPIVASSPGNTHPTAPRVAVVLPCYNEGATIAQVVTDFRCHLPQARILVFDNTSTDSTATEARSAGAEVRLVPLRGKGNVVRRIFADVDADVYVMADGDGTYDAAAAPTLVAKLVDEGLDMVVGQRVDQALAAYRPGHRFGNRLLTRATAMIFGRAFEDQFSGYRVFSRRFVKSFPAVSVGFEIETELTVHALGMRMPVAEVPTHYGTRAEGSPSKLNTYRDGWRILMTILGLMKSERPLAFFSLFFLLTELVSVGLAIPLLVTYLKTGLVPRFPTAILCASLGSLGFLLLACGLVLDTVTRGRWEAKRSVYLTVESPPRAR